MENVYKEINGVTISIDYKVELIGLLITLSDEKDNFPSFDFDENNDAYIKELQREFGYLVNHPTVQKFFYLKDYYGLHYHNPIDLALSLDDNFEFKNESHFKFKDNEDIINFCKELKLLSEEIDFKNFYLKHREIYLKWIDDIMTTYQHFNIKDAIISYCGQEYLEKKFYTNLIPFETGGGYGVHLDGEAHNCFRAIKKTTDNQLFAFANDTICLPVSIHEFLHSIIDLVTAKYNIFNLETEYLVDKENPISSYGNDYCMINETIIRAMTTRIFYLLTGIDNNIKRLNQDEEKGFKYVKTVYEKLLEYESNREKYPNIDSFYPEIADEIIKQIRETKIKR